MVPADDEPGIAREGATEHHVVVGIIRNYLYALGQRHQMCGVPPFFHGSRRVLRVKVKFVHQFLVEFAKYFLAGDRLDCAQSRKNQTTMRITSRPEKARKKNVGVDDDGGLHRQPS